MPTDSIRAKCSVDNCERPARSASATLCGKHYQRSLSRPDGDVSDPKFKVGCAVDGCSGKHYSYGFCEQHCHAEKHRRRQQVLNSPGAPSCSVAECSKPVKSKGYCIAHCKRYVKYGDSNTRVRLNAGDALRYALEIAPAHTGTDCLIWPLSEGNKRRRGKVEFNGLQQNAARVVCTVAHGEPPEPTYEAAHKCNTPACVNPSHLYWATPSQNQQDRVKDGTSNRGERCGSNILSESDVRKIRALKGTMSQTRIGSLFGVTDGAIRQIYRRRTWAWLE